MLEPASSVAPALIAITPNLVGDVGRIGEHDPSFSRGHELETLEAEGSSNSEIPHRHPPPYRAVCVCCVFDQCQVILFSQQTEGVHVGWLNGLMTNDDGDKPVHLDPFALLGGQYDLQNQRANVYTTARCRASMVTSH